MRKGEQNLKFGICKAYINLLESIVKNDTVKIGKMCEKTLYREFSSSLQEINFNFNQVELLNF